MEPADLIWMNGEFVAWEDAKVHVLTHGLHYGTGVFEGVRCYDTEIGPAVFRHADHVERLFKSAELYYMPIPFDARAAAPGDARAHRPQRPALLLHPPAGLPRLRDDGPVPARRAGRRDDRRLGVGRLPRRGGQAEGHARQGLVSWRRISADSLIPHAKATRPVPQLDPREDREPQGRLRGGDPPRRPRLRLRGLGREHLRRARRRHLHAAADRGDPRRHQPQVGDPDRARPRLRGRRARPGPRRALPGRRGLHDRHRGRARAVCEIDDHAIGAGEPGEITRAVQTAFEDALHGRTERYREWLDPCPPVAERRRSPRRSERPTPSSSTTRPCATACRARA